MTTLTQTSLVISGVMPIWNPFKVNWPNPEASICESYTWQFPVKNKRCWSIQGRAREVYGPIREAIKRCVEERGQDLFEGADESCVPHSVNCLMVGSSKERARPYIVISCRQHEVSKRLMVWIKDTQEWRELIDHNPGFGGFLLLHDAPIRVADARVEVGSSLVYSSTDYTDIYDAPIFFSTTILKSYDKCPAHQARAGNIIYLDGVPFGLTVAHPLAEQKHDRPLGLYSPESGPVIYMDNDDDDCSITSELSSSAGSNLLQTLHPTPFTGSMTPKALSGQPNLVGRLVCGSPGTPDDIADWALFALSPEYLSNAPELPLKISDQIMPSEQRHDRPLPTRRKGHRATAQDILKDRSGHPSAKKISAVKPSDDDPRAVFTRDGNKDIRLGVLDGNESLVWLAGGHEYMSLQTVIMEKKVCSGDCGIWAFNRDGSWLGHLVAGMPSSNTAYFAQASEILLGIRRMTGVVASPLPSSLSRICAESMQKHGSAQTDKVQKAYVAALLAASAVGSEKVVRLLIKSGADLSAHYCDVLQAAAERGHETVIQLLIESVADIDTHDDLELKRAASERDHEKISQLLARSKARLDAYYGGALRGASIRGHEKVVQLLISSGAEITARCGDVLQAASERGDEKVIELLISSRANISAFHKAAIRAASKQHHRKVVQLLTSSKDDITTCYGDMLCIVSMRGYTKIVQLLLMRAADFDINLGDVSRLWSEWEDEQTAQLPMKFGAGVISQFKRALLAASENGHEDIAQLLIDCAYKTDIENGTALIAASRHGHAKVVQLLISSEYISNAQFSRALWVASERGDEKIVQLLIKSEKVDAESNAALRVASERGYENVVKLLLIGRVLYMAPSAPSSSEHDRALYAASERGHEKVVQLLLDYGTHLDPLGLEMSSALYVASSNGHVKVAQLFLAAGVDVNNQKAGYGSAICAAVAGGYEAMVQLLIKSGVDVNARGGRSRDTALNIASRQGSQKLVQLLLDAGADVHAQGPEGKALHIACERNHESVVRLLVTSGANINAQGTGKFRDTVLNIASRQGNEKLVQVLLDAGADIHTQGPEGDALHVACEHNREGVVRLLIDAGADVNARRGRRTTALDIASQLGYEKIVQLLLNAGAVRESATIAD